MHLIRLKVIFGWAFCLECYFDLDFDFMLLHPLNSCYSRLNNDLRGSLLEGEGNLQTRILFSFQMKVRNDNEPQSVLFYFHFMYWTTVTVKSLSQTVMSCSSDTSLFPVMNAYVFVVSLNEWIHCLWYHIQDDSDGDGHSRFLIVKSVAWLCCEKSLAIF